MRPHTGPAVLIGAPTPPATPNPLKGCTGPAPATEDHPEPRWATMAEAAAYVGGGISPRTVREWGAAGTIPVYKFGPRFVRVDLNDLDAMAERVPTAGTMPEGWSA